MMEKQQQQLSGNALHGLAKEVFSPQITKFKRKKEEKELYHYIIIVYIALLLLDMME